MTEAEWLTSNDPRAMLTCAGATASYRQLRHLMVVPTLRVVQRVGGRHWSHHAELLERYATGELTRAELDRHWLNRRKRCDAFDMFGFPWGSYGFRTLSDDTTETILWFLRRFLPDEIILQGDEATWQAASESSPGSSAHNAMTLVVNDLRCIVGNPFRPVAFDPHWRTDTVTSLASAIYAERAFDRLPILADALEEAGCDSAYILSHCRGPGPHARGCWVVDGVLCKE